MGRESGSAVVESIFAIVFLMFLVLGVIEVAFALYARNVVAASAHEGARAAIELGRDESDALAIARDTVRRAAGGLVDDLQVDADARRVGDLLLVTVKVGGTLRAFGPVPIPVPLSAVARTTRDAVP